MVHHIADDQKCPLEWVKDMEHQHLHSRNVSVLPYANAEIKNFLGLRCGLEFKP